jgi:hypothetical protein
MPREHAIAVIGRPRANTVIQGDTGMVTGQVQDLPATADLRVAYRRPDQANLTVSASPCVVVGADYRCPPLRLVTEAARCTRLEIVVVRIDQNLRQNLRRLGLDGGVFVTMLLPRFAELAHVPVRCS